MTRVIRSLLRVLPILATSITMVNAEDFAVRIPAPENPNLPTVAFNETELFRVLDHQGNKTSPVMLEDGTASPHHLDKKSPAMLEYRASNPPPGPPPNPWPNGECPKPLYVDSYDDRVCDAKFARDENNKPDGTIVYAAWSSKCTRAYRKITCKLCFGHRVPNPHVSL
ncbi:hypothetical protein EsDP_00000086 [Epichloe bromicola]|uniref:Uncharacterized protein n=1 Tax=Epichloe bromicola TaxID=79588 RepID=A0ABQ0CDV6_9HYPO